MARIAITGGNRGVGLAMVRRAAERGDEVIACVREPDAATDLRAVRGKVRVLELDVTDPHSCAVAAKETGGTLDMLICNAGALIGRGGLSDPAYTREAWETVLMVNVAGPFFTARAFAPLLRRPGGKIAVISSRMGSNVESTTGGSYAYRASKAGATNLAGNLARELAPEGIAVGSWHPGWVRTDMGGSGADISAEESAAGLLARFDALSMETTGIFEDYAGKRIAF